MSETIGFQAVTNSKHLRDEGAAMMRAGSLISAAEAQADLHGAEDRTGFVAGFLAAMVVELESIDEAPRLEVVK